MTVVASGAGQRSPGRLGLVMSGMSPGPRMRRVAKGASTVSRTMVSVSMVSSPLSVKRALHTPARGVPSGDD